MLVRCREDVIHSRMWEEGVLLDLRTKVYFTLDPMGNALYERLLAGQGREAIVSELKSAFPDEPPEQIVQGVATFISSLVEEGLLEEGGTQ